MTFSLASLFLWGVAYLLLLFLIAYATERGWISRTLIRHPATYALSLGVYATSWSFYGSVGFAQAHGYSFLTIYLGVTIAFVLTPVLLRPIMRLAGDYQLTSLADLFAFRFRSQLAGILVTLFMLAGTLPYLALQIRAVTESIQVLTQEVTPRVLAFGFCVTLVLFAILFGARHISPREKHEGLVVAIAFESLVKLVAMLAVGAFALFGVFGGLGGVDAWLADHPEALEAMYRPAREGPWVSLLFLAFCAAFLLPRQFHMAFTESIEPDCLSAASWRFPLFLLLFNLSIPLILWAAIDLQVTTPPDYYVLGVTLGSGRPLLTLLAFVGGLSAASAMMIVTTLALAAMSLNHLLLPAGGGIDPTVNLYRWLIWGRRMIIAVIVMAGFLFYIALENNEGLVQLGLLSFVAVAQFLPGLIGVLYWNRANRYGFLAGLIGGAIVWFATLIVPLMERAGQINTGLGLVEIGALTGQARWGFSTFWSLAVNGLLFVSVSLLSRQSADEREAAHACTFSSSMAPTGWVAARSPREFREQLTGVLGADMARTEVDQALADLRMDSEESDPRALRSLRDRIERNLSGLVGPVLARMLVTQQLRLNPEAKTAFADSMRMIEERLEASRSQLRGLAVELDDLRRYHRQVLEDLPTGVCSIDPDGDIVIWNKAMEQISGITRSRAAGRDVAHLPGQWASILGDFLAGRQRDLHKLKVTIDDRPRWLSLHKAALDPTAGPVSSFHERERHIGSVILIEDLTENHLLEAGLAHTERLASLGRLAAGVAHEIGNPVTGIACLAQNMEAETSEEKLHQSIEQILAQTRRIANIVQSLVNFSHGGDTVTALRKQPVCVRDCATEAIQLVQWGQNAKQIEFENRIDPDLRVLGDDQKLLQVLVNVLSNAGDASVSGQKVVVSTRSSATQVTVDVRDHGSGIAPEVLAHVFEPFVTTKHPDEGTGLGMALAYRIVKDHGGAIDIDSHPGAGTSVGISLPRCTTESAAAGQAVGL